MYAINLNKISPRAYSKIHEMDSNFISTPDYLGLAYFWNYEYRHYLRDATIQKRQKIHSLFLYHGLAVNDATDKHLKIIQIELNQF